MNTEKAKSDFVKKSEGNYSREGHRQYREREQISAQDQRDTGDDSSASCRTIFGIRMRAIQRLFFVGSGRFIFGCVGDCWIPRGSVQPTRPLLRAWSAAPIQESPTQPKMKRWDPRNSGAGWPQAGPRHVKARSGQLVTLSANRGERTGAVLRYLLIGWIPESASCGMSTYCVLYTVVRSIKPFQICQHMFLTA